MNPRIGTEAEDLTSVLSNCHKHIIILYMAGETAKSVRSLPCRCEELSSILSALINKAGCGVMLS